MYKGLRLENQLCFRLYSASRLVTQAYRKYLDPLGLTYPQYLVMLVLWESDNMPVNDIARRLMLETNTVTPLLQRMEKEGFVQRSRGATDGRQMIVSLSDKGRRMKHRAKNVPTCISADLKTESFTPEKLYDFISSLDAIIAESGKVRTEK